VNYGNSTSLPTSVLYQSVLQQQQNNGFRCVEKVRFFMREVVVVMQLLFALVNMPKATTASCAFPVFNSMVGWISCYINVPI